MRATSALCLVMTLSAVGCASTVPDATTSVKAEGTLPAGFRLTAPRIVADDADLELDGDELTPEARLRFERARAQRIRENAEWVRRRVTHDNAATRVKFTSRDEQAIVECVLRAGIVCPAILVVGFSITYLAEGMVGQTARGVAYISGSISEPSLHLSPAQAQHIALVLKERASGAALAEHALSMAPHEFASADEAESLLVVRMRTARSCETEGAGAICLIAEAQGFLADGTALAPTQHVFVYGPLEALASDKRPLLEMTLDEALERLAESIVGVYTGGGPAPEPVPEPFEL